MCQSFVNFSGAKYVVRPDEYLFEFKGMLVMVCLWESTGDPGMSIVIRKDVAKYLGVNCHLDDFREIMNMSFDPIRDTVIERFHEEDDNEMEVCYDSFERLYELSPNKKHVQEFRKWFETVLVSKEFTSFYQQFQEINSMYAGDRRDIINKQRYGNYSYRTSSNKQPSCWDDIPF